MFVRYWELADGYVRWRDRIKGGMDVGLGVGILLDVESLEVA